MAHRHKWQIVVGCADDLYAQCACGGTLEYPEMLRRLDAADRLPLQTALQIAWDLEHAAGVAVGDEYEALQDYVAELEG